MHRPTPAGIPTSRPNPAPGLQPGNAWRLGFTLVLSPSGIPFNTAPQITGVVPSGIPSGTNTLNMATLRNNAWGDVGSFLVGSGGAITETLPSVLYPGVQTTGTYGVYVPVTPIASNYGIALIADDGNGFGPSAHALQVVTLFDALGHPLTTPTIKYLSFPNAYDLDGQALTPDGSQGILVDGGNTVRFFSQVQTGNPVASATTVDISQFGGDGDAVAIMPDGNEAVVSGDDSSKLVLISGISSGTPQLAAPIGIPGSRDGLVLSNDGKVMLARGGSSITVFQITPITPVTGSLGGKVYHSFANTGEISNAPGSTGEDGRNGMAFSPVDSSRAVVVGSGTIALIQGLPDNPTLRSSSISGGAVPYAVSISFDGKLAVVGTDKGLALYAGVDTGLLTPVGPLFAPSFQSGGTSYFLGDVKTLGITLDGKHVVACSQVPSSQNGTLLVIPFSRSGFQAPVGQLDGVAVPDNDQLVMH